MASQEEIRSGLAALVEEVTGIPAGRVVPEASFSEDLDIDSLSMVEIVVAAEERFGVQIPDDDVSGLRTVGEAVGYIARAGVAA
jgi:acyl carrier protein